ncbi:MAG: thermonuclease family protein [Elusimicrobiaceae bacterium]|nr:thermonuclease family protein [Elusimicrobiaceae bacterium]
MQPDKRLFATALLTLSALLYTTGCMPRLAVKPAPAQPAAAVISTDTLKYGAREVFTGVCEKVYDGDTILVRGDGREEKIRFYGIDTPESRQDYGPAAKQFTSDMVYGKRITVYGFGKEYYGRTLGIIEVEGRDLNLELVKAGLAWHYKQYSSDPALAAAETAARQAKLGLWCDGAPQAPWDWRRHQRKKSVSGGRGQPAE